jgi:hypothetical protein
MAIKKALIKTTLFKEGESYEVPVFYSDELQGTTAFDLSYNSIHGRYLPYLFAGYFSEDKKEGGKWYFANARRHEEMRIAVEQEVGKSSNYTYGQIRLKESALNDGIFCFDLLILHGELPNKKEAEKKLREVVNSNLLSDDFVIINARI